MSPDSLPIKLRRARGSMTLSEAAAKAEISEARIREYEEGTRHPYMKTLKKLAGAYGCTVSELLDSARNSIAVRRSPRRRPRAEINDSSEAPIAAEQGREIRIVIEIVLRTEAAATAVSSAAESHQATQPAGNGDTGGVQPAVPPVAETHRPRGRRIPARRFSREPFAKDGDPLVEFRRAYREFRERK
ncbi:MAG TPA: helix-turn-helix transcriptional regulator [Longimicrobiales bacterium]|nr:helix-turn-helix transcriptional regulator [Longimicrobiales bacterium]